MSFDISVIIPCFNNSNTITKAIHSAINQTYPIKEVIVIDNGSTDGSINIINNINNPIVKIFHCGERGPSFARNLGISQANCEWLAFLDADDYWMPNKIERQIKYYLGASNKSKIGLIFSGRLDRESNCKASGRIELTEMLSGNIITTSSVLIKLEALNDASTHAYFNTKVRFSEDWLLWLKVGTIYELHYVDEPLIHYTKSGVTKYDWGLIEFGLKELLSEFVDFYSKRVVDDRGGIVKAAYHTVYMHLAIYAAKSKMINSSIYYVVKSIKYFSFSWYFDRFIKVRNKVFLW